MALDKLLILLIIFTGAIINCDPDYIREIETIANYISKIRHGEKCVYATYEAYRVLLYKCLSKSRRNTLEEERKKCQAEITTFYDDGYRTCNKTFSCDRISQKCICLEDKTKYDGKACVYKKSERCTKIYGLNCENGYQCLYKNSADSYSKCTIAYENTPEVVRDCISRPNTANPEGDEGQCCTCRVSGAQTPLVMNFTLIVLASCFVKLIWFDWIF